MEDLTAPRSVAGLHIVRLPMTDSDIGPTSDEGAPRAGSRGSLRRNNPGHYQPSRIRGGLGWRAPGRELGLMHRLVNHARVVHARLVSPERVSTTELFSLGIGNGPIPV